MSPVISFFVLILIKQQKATIAGNINKSWNPKVIMYMETKRDLNLM